MKSRTAFAISVFFAAVALSFDASAVPETPAAGQTANTAPTTSTTTKPTTPLHSHMTEKLSVPAEQAASSDSDHKTSTKDKAALKRHDHQREMK